MGRIIDTLAVVLLATALLTAGVHAGQHDGLHVTSENETVSSTADTSMNVTFVVNNTANRPVPQGKLAVTNYSGALEPNRTDPIDLDRLNASEERRVPVEVAVSDETPPGNYTVSVEVREGNRTVDNATAVVLVETTDSEGDNSGSSGSDGTIEQSGNESSGSTPPPVVVRGDNCREFLWFEFCNLPSLGDIIDLVWPF